MASSQYIVLVSVAVVLVALCRNATQVHAEKTKCVDKKLTVGTGISNDTDWKGCQELSTKETSNEACATVCYFEKHDIVDKDGKVLKDKWDSMVDSAFEADLAKKAKEVKCFDDAKVDMTKTMKEKCGSDFYKCVFTFFHKACE